MDGGPRGGAAGAKRETLTGGLYGLSAYFLWGLLPLYFLALAPTSAWEVVAWRIVLSLVFCALLLTILRTWRRVIAILRRPRLAWLTVLAAVLILVNWTVYVYGTFTGHVLEASLGYFINPLVTLLLAVFVRRERLRIAQWTAIGIAAAAVVVIVIGYGTVPWIALVLAFSFGFYGLVKKQIGPSVDAVSGLTLESLWLTPPAVVVLIVIAAGDRLTLGAVSGWHTFALAAAGVATAVPLLLFAAASRRSSLATMGILQFVAPILQFAIGAWILQEPMPTERWIGFALVWVALLVFMVDSVAAGRGRRAVAPVTDPV